jgi:hypothetical protein
VVTRDSIRPWNKGRASCEHIKGVRCDSGLGTVPALSLII